MKSLPERQRRVAAAAAAAAGLIVVLLPWLAAGAAGAPIGGDSDTPGQATLNIQTNKLSSLVDERFLSLSVDPEQLLRHSQPGPGALRLLSMASALSPAYLRVAGPNTELMGFEGSPAHVGGTLKVNDVQWSALQSLCREAGLRAIIGLSARRRPGGSSHWDSRDAMRILAAVDASSEAPAGWQLGVDWLTLRRDGISPSQAAKDVKVLRSLIDEFPTLAKEAQILLGPDADPTSADADAQSEFTKGAHIGATIIRPFTPEDPTGSRLDRDFITKVLGRNPKRPLWIAESGEQCTAPFSSGLLWAQRLSTATRLGVQVILREIDLDASRNNATSDLWVSLLHKTLTSRGVLEMRGNGPEAGDLSMSAYCTPSNKDNVSPKTQPISPAIRYNLGAVTVMAANPSNRPLRLSLKMAGATGIGSSLGAPEDGATVVHEYILTAPGNDLNSTQTLLNGSPLEIAPGGGIPKLSPRHLQLDSSANVLLPPRSIAFWVVPGAKAKACQAPPASSDVAPAASRLRPISARDMEIGVHLDDDMPLPDDPEPTETARQAEDIVTADSSEAKDSRRGRHRLSDRLSGSSRLSLPRITPPRRPNFDLSFGRSNRDQEIRTLDDFIREELRSRPRSRSLEPPKLPSLPSNPLSSFDLPNMPAISGLLPSMPDIRPLELPSLPSIPATPLSLPNGRPIDVPNMLSIPPFELPTIPTLGQLDTSAILDPLNMNADLRKLNSDIQHGIVQQATTPLRSLVKITDGLLDRIEGSPNANRAKRSAADGPLLEVADDEYRSAGFELDDRLRYRRKSAQGLKTDDLPVDQHKTLSEEDTTRTHPIVTGEGSSRLGWDAPRYRRFAPEDIGLRFKRKPAIPEFLSLPRVPKMPLLPTSAAKRAHLLISQNEEGVPAHRDMFPQGDVYAEGEGPSDARDPDVDYVSDDDYLPTSPTSSSKQPMHGSARDALYLAPAAIYETTMAQRNVPPRASTRTGEIGELEYFSGKTSPRVDDTAADSFKVVPAARPSKEQEAEIQSKLQKRLEEHYTEVQKAALDKKAQAQSAEDVSEEIDEDSLRALAERYRKEKKLNLPEGTAASGNGLQKQAETKETEKTEAHKTRTRRDLGERLSAMHSLHKPSSNTDASAKEGSESGRLFKRGASASGTSLKTPEKMRERRMENVKTVRERLARSGSNRPQLPHRGHDHTHSSRPKRNIPSEQPPSVERALREIQKQIDKDGIDLFPWDSTGTDTDSPKIPEPNKEDLTPLARNRGLYTGNRHRPYGGYGSFSRPSGQMRPSYPSRFGPPHSHGSYSSHGYGSSHGYRPSHGYNMHSSQSEESCEDSEEWHSGYYPHRQRFPRPRSGSDSNSRLDLPEDVNIEDYPTEERTLRSKEPVPQILPNVVTVPWEISRPTNVRFKRFADNSLIQPKPEPGSPDDISSAIRKLHKVLNEDDGSSEEKSAEVNHGGRLIDSSETVDGLENLIQSLLNMTRHLNETINEAKNDEMVSWKDFDLDEAKPADPQLDSEEMKYRDAAVAWIQAAKKGDMIKSGQENGSTDQQVHSVKQRPGVGEESAGKRSAHQQKLTEQENIVTAMMQRVSVLLSELRTMLNKKEVSPTVSSKNG